MQIDTALAAAGALVTGTVGSALAIVRFVVPRIDAGYRAALKIQESHQERLAKSQEALAEHLRETALAQAETAHAMARVAEQLAELGKGATAHEKRTAVHAAQVDGALRIQSGPFP